MSLMGTLAKVAVGIAVAKGVSSMMGKKAQAGTGSAGSGGTFGGPNSPGAGGGLEDMMGEMLGGKRGGTTRTSAPQGGGTGGGGLGDLLNELGGYAPGGAGQTRGGGSQTGGGGGLDDLIGSLGGGQGGGGLGDVLGGLLGGAQGKAGQAGGGGSLGDLLGGLLGGAMGGAAKGGGGGFGDLLNQSLGNRGEPDATPTPQQNAAAGLMLVAMIQAAKADGKVDAAEQKKLLGNLGDITAEEKRFVEAQLAAPVNPEGLARQVPQGLEAQVYMMSLMAIDLDNRNEAQYLHQLATAMGLNQQVVNQIHAQIGAPALYA
ncbi:MAG: tellurite resistance TerB family protein [Proteobacteria bacterium]|nr:tellurite resistance TerB family protein [Pseudomonadota bacterium]